MNNLNVSLDRLDEAHDALLNETKILVDHAAAALIQYLQDQFLGALGNLSTQLSEISGALLFLNASEGQQALKNAAQFVQQKIETSSSISEQEINYILDTLASAEMMIDNLKNKQPVLHSMFDVALSSSQKLNAEVVA